MVGLTAAAQLVGPAAETTDVLWIEANLDSGLSSVPYFWAGVYVLETARFLFPTQHFCLVDNDCVPVTLFEVPDLVRLAEGQYWSDVMGHSRPHQTDSKVGMILFTEAHHEYNAGLVVSTGQPLTVDPLQQTQDPVTLAGQVMDSRQALLAKAEPSNPS